MRQKSKAVQHLSIIDIQDEFGTPIQTLEKGMNDLKIRPTLDVCTNDVNAKFPKYFTKFDDALKQEWDEDFFMNPPYSKVDIFMAYAYNQYKKHNVNGLILTYSKTDTEWFHTYVYNESKDKWLAEFYPIKGRINFNDEYGIPTEIWSKKDKKYRKGVAPYPSCWIVYRKK